MKWAVPVAVLAIAGIAVFWPKLQSAWSANLGAVLMARIELADFPLEKWEDSYIAADLSIAESLFLNSLSYNPSNLTANHRLGLVAIQRGDFITGARYLEAALEADPNHRGIVKNLGYCYVWLGQLDQAQILLQQIPEARQEMNVYTWWWNAQGRSDLAAHAEEMSKLLLPAN
jgi:lipopolysaccharide biosynthesis regulator YciM